MRTHLRAMSLCAGLFVGMLASPAASQSPPIDVELNWRMESVIKGIQHVFLLEYAASTDLSAQEFAAYFPAEAFGGARDTCAYGSAGGLLLALERDVRWTEGWTFGALIPELLIVGPEQVAAVVEGTQAEAVSSYVSVFDANLSAIAASSTLSKRSGKVTLYADLQSGATAWQASVTFDCWCSYRDPGGGPELGRLYSGDIGGAPITQTAFGDRLPSIVPTESETWSALKSRF